MLGDDREFEFELSVSSFPSTGQIGFLKEGLWREILKIQSVNIQAIKFYAINEEFCHSDRCFFLKFGSKRGGSGLFGSASGQNAIQFGNITRCKLHYSYVLWHIAQEF